MRLSIISGNHLVEGANGPGLRVKVFDSPVDPEAVGAEIRFDLVGWFSDSVAVTGEGELIGETETVAVDGVNLLTYVLGFDWPEDEPIPAGSYYGRFTISGAAILDESIPPDRSLRILVAAAPTVPE